MFLRSFFSLLLVALIYHAAAADNLTPEKTNDIKRLIEMTGGTNIAKQFSSAITQQLVQMLKSAKANIPDSALQAMEKDITTLITDNVSAPGGLVDQVVPIYDKYLTHPEVKELLAFYQTPLGTKVRSVLPQITQESMHAGQQWAQKLGPEIDKRVEDALKREGLLPKTETPAPAPAAPKTGK
jgi:hypothetical protein